MDWVEYWNQDHFWSRSELWKVDSRIFFEGAAPILQFKKTDSVLNVGCGPGYLEQLLAPRVERITSVDASKRFVALCRKNCRGIPNVDVRLLKGDTTDLSPCGGGFSLFLAVGVVQYYRDPAQVEALIHSARRLALAGARMLIADLPQRRSPPGFAWDAWRSFLLSLRGGYTAVLFRAAGSLAFGRSGASYRSFSRGARTLYFSDQEIQGLAQRLGLKATVIQEDLSVYANRPSLLIQF
ncbi:MAG: class I SAM-dependent methyltransferase [Candidatus Omnitrophica bacterium]|nr:class I SAM-dependent methyltransferase [Candidatus Omnitrophota bacterium]